MNAPTLVKVLPKVNEFLGLAPGIFVDGERRSASSGQLSSIYNPATGAEIAKVASADAGDTGRAVQSTHAAHKDGRWRKLRPADRERILLKFADLVERDGEFLAQLETLEQGKSINISRAIEVGGAVEYMRYAAGLATKITGMTLDVSMPAPPGGQYTAYTRREPVGVVAAIAPWNFPMMIALWKIMPALAAGCTLVLKPAEVTPLTALYLAQLAVEAGVPAGVFNVVTGKGSVCGEALVNSPLISKITFTGSTAVGKSIGRAAIENMTRVSLELGGKNPAIVLNDADLDVTVGGLMMGAFLNQGQVCAAASRVYVEAGIYDKLTEALSGAVGSLAIGPGLDEATQITPLVSAGHQKTVASYIEDAASAGATLVQGKDGPEPEGYYVRPTLVLNPDTAIRLTREEVFGPVLALTRVSDAEEALTLANDSEYGLSASLWTQNLNAAMNMIPRIEAGTVWVNSHVPIDPNLPFGGYKQSGIGRDFGPRWLDAYTEEKSVCIAH